MSCQANSVAVARLAGSSGISTQSNRAVGLAGQNKRIIISDTRTAGSRYIALREDGLARSRTVPLVGQTIEIAGPSQIVSTHEGAWWIMTRAEIKGFSRQPEGDNEQQANRRGGKGTRLGAGQKMRLVSEAIKQKRQIQVDYRTAKGKKRYTLAPLDVRRGQKKYKKNHFLLGYSAQEQKVRRLRMDRIVSIQVGKGTFDPEEVVARAWPGKKVQWYLPRAWGGPAQSTVRAKEILDQAAAQFEDLDWQIDRGRVQILDLAPSERRPAAARTLLRQLKEAGYEIIPDHPGETSLPFWRTMYQEGFIDDDPDTLTTREEAMAELALKR